MDDRARELLELLAKNLEATPEGLSQAMVNYTAHCAWMQLANGMVWGLFALLFFAGAVSSSREKDSETTGGFSFLVSVGLLMVSLSKIFAAVPVIMEPMGATIKGLL